MPKINRLTANRAPVGPRPDPEAMGAAEGRALQSIGNAVGNVGSAVTSAGQQIANIRDGYQQQLSIARSTEAEDNLRRFAEDLAQDPDFQSRESRFNDRAAELREELGRDIAPGVRRAEFENSITRARNTHAVNVRSTALRDEMLSAQLLANETTRKLATVAATANTNFDQLVARLEGEGVLQNLGEKFGVDPVKTDEAIRQFNIEVDDAILTNQMRTDPVSAYRGLEVPDQGLAAGRTEVERQTLLTKAMNEIESRLLSSEQRESSQARLDELKRKELAIAAKNSFIELAMTPQGLSVDDVNKVGDVLLPNEKEKYIQFALNGGKLKPQPELDPMEFQRLRKLAKAGNDITDEVFASEIAGRLTPGARTSLLNMDVRFAIADDQLERALKVGEFIGSPAVRARNAEAMTLYEMWKVEHPNATLNEAIAEASVQAKRALIFDDSSITAFQLPPKFSVYDSDGKTLNIEETQNALTRAMVAGEISEDEFDREQDLLDQFHHAQKAQAERDRIKAQLEAQEAGK